MFPDRSLMPAPQQNLYQEDDENCHGPMDGVRPHDFPETYEQLLKHFCVKPFSLPIYCLDNKRRVCQDCYENGLDNEVRVLYQEGGYHSMCRNAGVANATKCHVCQRRIAYITPAGSCTECIEEFFEVTGEDLRNMSRGKTIDVLTRW